MVKIPTQYREYSRFFLPLAFQSAAQSFTYPLVAMVASNAPGGALNLAGLAQSNSITFLLGTIGSGMITAGMVFSKSKHSFANFCKVNLRLAICVAVLQLLLNVPFFSHFIFETLIGLPQTISKPAQITFLASIPVNFLFFLRNPSFVLLYNGKATKLAGFTTLFRIVLTLILSSVFVSLKLTGPVWAVVCQTIPLTIETILAYTFSRNKYKELPDKPEIGGVPNPQKIFLFNLPLSAGGLFLSLSSMTMGAFIARSNSPEIMLPVYYLVLGLVNPVAFAISRIQTVVLTFPPLHPKDNRTLKYGIICAIIAGFIPLIFILPGIADLYYVNLQNLPAEHLRYARITAIALLLHPLAICLRLHSEGLAAHLLRPTTILAGQAVYLGSVTTLSFFFLNANLPGNLIGPFALISANLFAALTVRYSLNWEHSRDIPVPKIPSSTHMQ